MTDAPPLGQAGKAGGTPSPAPLTKRPHYVPRCYLEPWADASRQVSVRRRSSPRAYAANIDDVAVKRGIYGTGIVGQRREDFFKLVEDNWKNLRSELVETGSVSTSDRREAAVFLALQIARTREHVAQNEFVLSLAEYAEARPLDRADVRRYLREVHLGFDPSDAEVEGAWSIASYMIADGKLPSREQLLGTSLDIAVSQVAPALEAMHWSVETCRRSTLLTSDRPIMYWRPASRRDEEQGTGLLGAVETRMPLSPSALLVLRRSPSASLIERVEPKRFEAVNLTTLAQSFEFVVATTSQKHRLSAAHLQRTRPALRFGQAPGVQVDSQGRETPMNDIIHTWIPSPSR